MKINLKGKLKTRARIIGDKENSCSLKKERPNILIEFFPDDLPSYMGYWLTKKGFNWKYSMLFPHITIVSGKEKWLTQELAEKIVHQFKDTLFEVEIDTFLMEKQFHYWVIPISNKNLTALRYSIKKEALVFDNNNTTYPFHLTLLRDRY